MILQEVDHHHFSEIDSTNKWAKEKCSSFNSEHLTLVTADSQSHGRGRRGSIWLSPKNCNLYATFTFFPPVPISQPGHFTQILAVSLAEVLLSFNFSPQIKWPNDLFLSHKKLAGILCETSKIHSLLCVIIGIGVNVNMLPDQLLFIDQKATSLFAESDKIWDVKILIERLTKAFQENLNKYFQEGLPPFLPFMNTHDLFQGKKVCLKDGNRSFVGDYLSIQPCGGVRLSLGSGIEKTFFTGSLAENPPIKDTHGKPEK